MSRPVRGELDFTVNKYDVDLRLRLYELTTDGVYVKLFDPAYSSARATRATGSIAAC